MLFESWKMCFLSRLMEIIIFTYIYKSNSVFQHNKIMIILKSDTQRDKLIYLTRFKGCCTLQLEVCGTESGILKVSCGLTSLLSKESQWKFPVLGDCTWELTGRVLDILCSFSRSLFLSIAIISLALWNLQKTNV